MIAFRIRHCGDLRTAQQRAMGAALEQERADIALERRWRQAASRNIARKRIARPGYGRVE